MSPGCAFPGCEAARYARDLCSGHAWQRREGIPLRPIHRTFEDRFWAKVDKTGDCWIWTGSKNHLGYGHIHMDGRLHMAHRASLMLAGIDIPRGHDVDHLCRVPSCVRPEHLEPVTHAVNMERAPHTAIHFQAQKTHCPAGHEYTPANTYLRRNSSGTLSRECRSCRRARRQSA